MLPKDVYTCTDQQTRRPERRHVLIGFFFFSTAMNPFCIADKTWLCFFCLYFYLKACRQNCGCSVSPLTAALTTARTPTTGKLRQNKITINKRLRHTPRIKRRGRLARAHAAGVHLSPSEASWSLCLVLIRTLLRIFLPLSLI